MSADRRRDRAAAFWDWFAANHSALGASDLPDEALMASLLERLHRVDDGLFFEVCVNVVPHELVITTEGDPSRLVSANELVSLAPELAGWCVVATKQPTRGRFTIRTANGETLDLKDMWFLPLASPNAPGAIGLRVAVTGIESENLKRLTADVLRVIEAVLGERRAAGVIGHVELVGAPSDPTGSGFIAMEQLGAYVAWRERIVSERNDVGPSR